MEASHVLLVKTKLSTSTIHGFGVLADEQIPAGKEVWKFQPGFDLEKSEEEMKCLPEVASGWFKNFGYLDHHFNKYILSFDNARFINHSEEPNLRPDYTRDSRGVGIAQKAIEAGEELTINYREIEQFSYLDRQ
jgi:SET domain-containing protein